MHSKRILQIPRTGKYLRSLHAQFFKRINRYMTQYKRKHGKINK